MLSMSRRPSSQGAAAAAAPLMGDPGQQQQQQQHRLQAQRSAKKKEQAQGFKLVGKRISVRYTNGIWYPGLVKQWNSRRGLLIAFDDGDRLWTKDSRVDLTPLNCKILGPGGKRATAELLGTPSLKPQIREHGHKASSLEQCSTPQIQVDESTSPSAPVASTARAQRKRKSPLSTSVASTATSVSTDSAATAVAAAAASPPQTSMQRSPPSDSTISAELKRSRASGQVGTGTPQSKASGVPGFIPTTETGEIIGIRTTQPLPPAPPHFSTPLSSPLCDASVIVSHQPSVVREALQNLQNHSLHLPVGEYLEQLITLFTCIDSVVPLYAARGQTLTYLHAVEVVASQLRTQFEVRQFAQIVALHPQTFSIRRCTAGSAASKTGISRDRRRLRAEPTARLENWFIEWPVEDTVLCSRQPVVKKSSSSPGATKATKATSGKLKIAEVLKRRALDFRRAVVSWVRQRHAEFLLAHNIVAAQWVPEAKGWHTDFDLSAAVASGAQVPQARLPTAQVSSSGMHSPLTSQQLRRAMFLRDDDSDLKKTASPADTKASSSSSELENELRANGVDAAILQTVRDRSGRTAQRLDRIAERKLDSDFKQLLPLCDLIHMRYRSKKRSNEKLGTLVEAVRHSDRSGAMTAADAKARVLLLVKLLPRWCKIVSISTPAGKKKLKVDYFVLQSRKYDRKDINRTLQAARSQFSANSPLL